VWCFITGKTELEGVHSSLVDAKAQAEIVADKRFLAFIDRPESIKAMEEVWSRKRKSRDQHAAECESVFAKMWRR
jgi:hypothetical protein